jgi:SpoVK/Ycf46/Vps4 family AAA+-type ATPase
METSEKLQMYHLEKLPSQRWQRLGDTLVLNPQVKHFVGRFGEWHFQYQGGGSNLMLVWGLPGVGKTDLVRVAADAAVRNCGDGVEGNGLVVATESLFHHHLGQSAKQVKTLLGDIALSASKKRTVVLFNDAEGLFMSRTQSMASHDTTDLVRVATTLFQGLDELRGHPNLIMFATLNLLSEVLDEALVSRKAYILNVALPTYEERRAILVNELAGMASDRLLERLAEATEGKSGRDLVGIKQQAFLSGTGSPQELREEDFLAVLGLAPEPITSVEETPSGAAVESTESIGKEEAVCQIESSNESPQAVSLRRSKLIRPWRWFEKPLSV